MDLESGLKDVAVIGAAGKMGQGIALLLAQEMAFQEAKLEGKVGKYALHLVDSYEKGLHDLRHYLKKHLKRYAEKNIIALRSAYQSNPVLVSNEQIVNAFVEGAMEMMHFATHLENLSHTKLVFEAVLEEESTKINLLRTLKSKCPPDTLFFTNTSSIPVSYLGQQAGVEGRLIGFHFYNPPAVQKLVELINTEKLTPEISDLTYQLVERLKKVAVPANNIAGFIGNGHFIREIHYACTQVQEWTKEMPLAEAIYLMDSVTQEYLLRPMGIFQLIDYVGIDVCDHICKIMEKHLSEPLQSPLITEMIQAKILGGQHSDGVQKNGFFSYEEGKKQGVYSLTEKKYLPLTLFEKDKQSKIPSLNISWKSLHRDSQKKEKIHQHFEEMRLKKTWGAAQAMDFFDQSSKIAHLLVDQGVAKKPADVDRILELGFFYLYGVYQQP